MVYVVEMDEKLELLEYTEEYILQIEKKFPELKEWGREYRGLLMKGTFDWKKLYGFLEDKLDIRKSFPVGSINDIIQKQQGNMEYWWIEVLCYLKYSLLKSMKSLYKVSPYQECDQKILESIKKYIWAEDNVFRCDDNMDLGDALFHALDRIQRFRKENGFFSDIEFSFDTEGEVNDFTRVLILESDYFFVLQIMLLVNDRFNSVFYSQEKFRHCSIQYEFSILNNIQKSLKRAEEIIGSEDTDIYVWEKLTRMNAAILLTDFYIEMLERKEDLEKKGNQVSFDKKILESTVEKLARHIKKSTKIFRTLPLLQEGLAFILEHQGEILDEEGEYVTCFSISKLYNLEIQMEQLGKAMDDNNSAENDFLIQLAEIIIYLRNMCFSNGENYKKRKDKLIDEINHMIYIKGVKGFGDERTWYINISKSLDYFGVASQYELSPAICRHNENYGVELRRKLKKDIENSEWISLEELADVLMNEGWYAKEVIYKKFDSSEEGKFVSNLEWRSWLNEISRDENSESLAQLLQRYYNPLIYKESSVLQNIKKGKLYNRWNEEYKIIQKILLYH